MNKDKISAEQGSVVVTGKVKGDISTNINAHEKASDDVNKNSPQSSSKKVAIIAALIAAIGTIISGLLIAGSHWFSS